MSLRDQNIVVTGAGRGIGAATAQLLAERGANLALCARTESQLKETISKIHRINSKVKVYSKTVDLSRPEEAVSFFEDAQKALGPISGLVNNAAQLIMCEVKDIDPLRATEIFQVNVISPFVLCREFFKKFKSNGARGSIVNIGSVAGLTGYEKYPGLSLYSATKGALVSLTESLAVEGRSLGIRVNLVAPGATDTQMLREALPGYEVKMQPEAMARTIAYFLDPEESSLITGSIMAASD